MIAECSMFNRPRNQPASEACSCSPTSKETPTPPTVPVKPVATMPKESGLEPGLSLSDADEGATVFCVCTRCKNRWIMR